MTSLSKYSLGKWEALVVQCGRSRSSWITGVTLTNPRVPGKIPDGTLKIYGLALPERSVSLRHLINIFSRFATRFVKAFCTTTNFQLDRSSKSYGINSGPISVLEGTAAQTTIFRECRDNGTETCEFSTQKCTCSAYWRNRPGKKTLHWRTNCFPCRLRLHSTAGAYC